MNEPKWVKEHQLSNQTGQTVISTVLQRKEFQGFVKNVQRQVFMPFRRGF